MVLVDANKFHGLLKTQPSRRVDNERDRKKRLKSILATADDTKSGFVMEMFLKNPDNKEQWSK